MEVKVLGFVKAVLSVKNRIIHRYNLRLFTDTNSVICKSILGTGKAPLV